MKDIVVNLVENVHKELKANLNFFWPASNTAWPHENNIGAVLASLSEKYQFRPYFECNIQGERRDMILVDKGKKWICQVELKHMHADNTEKEYIHDDLWRIYKLDPLKTVIKNTDLEKIPDENLYGLFLSFGKNSTYKWWKYGIEQTDENKNNIIKYFHDCGISNERINYHLTLIENWFNEKDSIKGIIPKSLPEIIENEQFWLCYYFIPCGNKK